MTLPLRFTTTEEDGKGWYAVEYACDGGESLLSALRQEGTARYPERRSAINEARAWARTKEISYVKDIEK